MLICFRSVDSIPFPIYLFAPSVSPHSKSVETKHRLLKKKPKQTVSNISLDVVPHFLISQWFEPPGKKLLQTTSTSGLDVSFLVHDQPRSHSPRGIVPLATSLSFAYNARKVRRLVTRVWRERHASSVKQGDAVLPG